MIEIPHRKVEDGVLTTEPYTYYSHRYGKSATIPEGFFSDNCTCVPDVPTDECILHDYLDDNRLWDDGSPVTAWQASTILTEELLNGGYLIEGLAAWIPTFLVFLMTRKRLPSS